MGLLRRVLDSKGKVIDCEIPGGDWEWDGEGRMLMLPALIDAHVHFRTPGAEHKEDWRHAARAAVSGGITTVFDMPNTSPATISLEAWKAKCALIDSQLASAGIPLRYKLYLGADARHLDEVPKCRDVVAGLKIYMGSTTGNLLMADAAAWDQAFRVAAENDLVVSVHAEDEALIHSRTHSMLHTGADASLHSRIRCPEAALIATNQAIALAEKHGARLYILHLSTAEELASVAKAKERGVQVFCEVCPHHLFLSTLDYAKQGTRVQMNPPLRDPEHCEALWEGIHSGIVDSIGTDHAPHTLEEKALPYGKAPSGVPGVETLLPLLLNAYHEDRLSLGQIEALTRWNNEEIFGLDTHNDVVLVDMDMELDVSSIALQTKCGWSPYADFRLKGWPVATVLRG
ncbi:MAG: dihydroorotase, partial [Chlamydiia bacterium]|nr:dihydroorotase [Chlamydiia bacterium]